MKIELTPDDKKLKLLKAVGSRTKDTSKRAQEILAAFVGPIIQQVLEQSATSSLIYTDHPYNFDDVPSIPLDLFDGNEEGLIDIWAQSIAGGLPTNLVHGMDDFRLMTYRLDSAVSFLKSYAAKARLDVVSLALRRMAQELQVKMEFHAWSPILQALGDATTNGSQHLIDATTTDVFQLDDMNRLWTLIKRLRRSWVQGTPTSVPAKGLTDIIVSPEIIEQIRSFAYQPMNTRTVDGTAGTPAGSSTALGLPDAVRQRFFDASGIPEIFGVGIIELQELGVGEAYVTLFDALYSGGGIGFDGANDDLVIGVDLSVDAFIRVVAQDSDTGDTIVVEPDDQFVRRQEKIGWFTSVEEGRAVIDNKAVCGIVV
jgi:hypothetical protein